MADQSAGSGTPIVALDVTGPEATQVNMTGPVSDDPDVAVLQRAYVALQDVYEMLKSNVRPLAPGQVVRVTIAEYDVPLAMIGVARLLSRFPDLAPRVDAATLVRTVALTNASEQVKGLLVGLTSVLQSTTQASLCGPWRDARDVYKIASVAALRSSEVERSLAPVRAIFARVPRTTSMPRRAADAERLAVKAASRAEKARQKADAAKAKSAAMAAAKAKK